MVFTPLPESPQPLESGRVLRPGQHCGEGWEPLAGGFLCVLGGVRLAEAVPLSGASSAVPPALSSSPNNV